MNLLQSKVVEVVEVVEVVVVVVIVVVHSQELKYKNAVAIMAIVLEKSLEIKK